MTKFQNADIHYPWLFNSIPMKINVVAIATFPQSFRSYYNLKKKTWQAQAQTFTLWSTFILLSRTLKTHTYNPMEIMAEIAAFLQSFKIYWV